MGRSLFPVVLLVILPALVASGATAIALELPFVPNPTADGAAELVGSTWVQTGPGFTVRVQHVDPAQRLAYIENVTGLSTDPFASRSGETPRYETFLLQLENHGSGPVVFRSQQCWLKTNKTEFLTPLPMEMLRTTYGMVGQELRPAYERAGAAVLPTTHDLLPGESLAGLLVYRRFKPKTKSFFLKFQLTAPSGDVFRMKMPYRRLKEKELESR